jgi:SAM-dependent methyltransferase
MYLGPFLFQWAEHDLRESDVGCWRQVMDALAMQLEDNSFDLVWACESGEHMPDKAKYVQEMTRVLAPGTPLRPPSLAPLTTTCPSADLPAACLPVRQSGKGLRHGRDLMPLPRPRHVECSAFSNVLGA